MKKLWLISSFPIIFCACRSQKIEEAVPVPESIEVEVNLDEIIPLGDSVQIEMIIDSQNVFQIKHGAMDQEIIDSVKTIKNNQKKEKIK